MIPVILQPKERAHLAPILLPDDRPDVAIVASFNALAAARRQGFKHIALAQHGIGQSYGGDPRGASSPGLPGGRRNDGVGLFLVPNEHAANRWRVAYPKATVAVVGSPRLDSLPKREPGPVTVAVSFHWDWYLCAESMSAFREYARAILKLAERFTVIGHAHPLRKDLPGWYAQHGIEFVADFDDVCRRADLYLADNTSTLFEFAATGRPVVVLNSARYRRDVNHGLRFWEASTVGLNVSPGSTLARAVEVALEDPLPLRAARERALDIVYQPRSGGASLASSVLEKWCATL